MSIIWVRSWNCGCLVTWFCYQLMAKPGNETAAVPWPDPYIFGIVLWMAMQVWWHCDLGPGLLRHITINKVLTRLLIGWQLASSQSENMFEISCSLTILTWRFLSNPGPRPLADSIFFERKKIEHGELTKDKPYEVTGCWTEWCSI